MKRVPVSLTESLGWKAELKPSVTRVEANRVPAAKRAVMVSARGAGDPVQAIPPPDSVANSPRDNWPTVILGDARLASVVERNAWTGTALSAPSWLTLALKLLMRMVAEPDGGTV